MSLQADTSKSSEDLKKKLQLATESKPTMSDIVRIAREWVPSTESQLLIRGDEPELPLKRLPTLNRKLWGIHKGKMTVIAGRTSQAKSVVAINVAWDLATQGKKVYFISLEMAVQQIIERIFCLEAKVDNYELLSGKIVRSDYIQNQWERFKSKINSIPLLMSDMIGRTWEEVDFVLTSLGTKPDVVIIDHLQEISARGLKKMDVIEEYLNHMRELAIRNNFALIVCSQVNRMGQADKDRRPQLHQLKGSGAIEEKADMVLLLHWQHHYDNDADKNLLEINVAKNRCGATGNIDVRFIPENSRLEDYNENGNSAKSNVDLRPFAERCAESPVCVPDVQRGDSQCPNDPSQIEWSE